MHRTVKKEQVQLDWCKPVNSHLVFIDQSSLLLYILISHPMPVLSLYVSWSREIQQFNFFLY